MIKLKETENKLVKKAIEYITQNNIDGLRRLLEEGLNPNSSDDLNRSLFFISLIEDKPQIVDLLLTYDIIIDSNNIEFVYAFSYCNSKIVKRLIDKYKNLDFRSNLEYAIEHGNDGAIKAVLESNININHFSNKEETLLMHLAKSAYWYNEEGEKKITSIIDLLIKAGVNVDNINKEGLKASDIAFYKGNIELGYYLRNKETFELDSHIKKLKEYKIPEEFLNYLRENEDTLEFKCVNHVDANHFSLCKLEEIRFSEVFISTWEYRNNYDITEDPNIENDGYYYIPIIDLIRNVNDYTPYGLLVWLPDVQQFGSCDTDHGVLYIFKDVDWDNLQKNICIYVNAQWEPIGRYEILDIYDYCKPWKIWKFEKKTF